MTYRGDVLSIETWDGEKLVFNAGETSLLAYGNLGAPPVNFITRRGYKQDGSTELDYHLEPRSWVLTLHHPVECDDRNRYWELRQSLQEFFRPNRGGPLKFTLLTEARMVRSIYARATPGLLFPPVAADRNDWAIEETVDLISFDPTFFDPETVELDLVGEPSTDLVFPITFPIVFGFEGAQFNADIVYQGTWQAYPTITISGPYSQAYLEQMTSGAVIQLTRPIASGEKRILVLDPSRRSLKDENGDDQWGDLGPSDVINWAIFENPIAPGGVNTLAIKIFNATVDSGVTITYNTRYYSI